MFDDIKTFYEYSGSHGVVCLVAVIVTFVFITPWLFNWPFWGSVSFGLAFLLIEAVSWGHGYKRGIKDTLTLIKEAKES